MHLSRIIACWAVGIPCSCLHRFATLSSVFDGRPGRLSCSLMQFVDLLGERGQVRWTRRVLGGGRLELGIWLFLVVAGKH